MSFHGIFKKVLNESTLAKASKKTASDVNEASDMLSSEELSIGALTRNNILPRVFDGAYNGLRIPSALINGQAVPVWEGDFKYTTYPFVGINGYSTKPAKSPKQGSETSFARDRLKSEARMHPTVNRILAHQVRAGTGIPANVFVLFPQMPISSVGSGRPKRSQSNFVTFNKRDGVSETLYPYNVQQALSIGSDGKLHPDPNKSGGTVLRPMRGSRGIMYADRLRRDDLARMAYLQLGHGTLAEWVTGSTNLSDPRAFNGSMIASYQTGAHTGIPGGNPNYYDFGSFAEEHGLVTEDGELDIIGIRRWILEEDSATVVDELIEPYLLITPFDRTYCWRILEPSKKYEMQNDIAVYEALLGMAAKNGGSVEKSIKEIEADKDAQDTQDGVEVETDTYDFDEIDSDDVDDSVQLESVEVDIESDDDMQKVLDESSNDTTEVGDTLMRGELMALFDRYVATHQNTIGMMPKKRATPALRDDDRVATKRSGVKKTFARILSENTELMDIDRLFCPKGVDGLKRSYSGVLNFAPLFRKYPNLVDGSMPKKFRFTRIVGYTVSYEYDPGLEEEYERSVGKGRSRSLGKLKHYAESTNSVRLREPTVFDVIYIKGEEYGNFLFSSYRKPVDGNVQKMKGNPPPEVVANRLYADNVDGLHSIVTHDFDRINIAYGYNTEVH